MINLIFMHAAKSICSLCSRPLQSMPQELIFLFLCRHVVHASCVSGGDNLPLPPDPILRHLEPATRGLSGSIALYVSGSFSYFYLAYLNFF
jgi:vacuolar protein sorting-associated protein 41